MTSPSWHEPHGTFEPAVSRRLGEIFEEAWASIGPDISKSRDETYWARDQLATIVIDLAKDGQLGDLQITHTAARLMRERASQARSTSK